MTKKTDEIRKYYDNLKNYFDTLIVGEEKAKDVIISALLCDTNSRILISGKPGTGKSTISDSLAKNFVSKKISITTDLLPSDLLSIILSCDGLELLQLEEINRTSPKVQSSLIEALGSNAITTSEGEKKLKSFYAIATQNDAEMAGIFDTPQAIFDRFDVNITFGNLTYEELEEVLFDFHRKIDAAPFNLKEIVTRTTQIIDEFTYSKLDRWVLMQAFMILKEATYYGKDIFASSTIRGDYFAKRMAALHAMVNGKEDILPSDIACYLSSIYLHRLNQAVLKMNSSEAKGKMKELKQDVLNIKRPKE